MIRLIRNEPVAFFGTIEVLFLAILTAAAAFQWWEWTEGQTAAVLGIFTAIVAFLTFLIRGKVTPANPLVGPTGQRLP